MLDANLAACPGTLHVSPRPRCRSMKGGIDGTRHVGEAISNANYRCCLGAPAGSSFSHWIIIPILTSCQCPRRPITPFRRGDGRVCGTGRGTEPGPWLFKSITRSRQSAWQRASPRHCFFFFYNSCASSGKTSSTTTRKSRVAMSPGCMKHGVDSGPISAMR